MTWTWDETDLSTALAQVRSAIGDTNDSDELLSDEQINWRLGQVSQDVGEASIRCVRDIIAQLSRDIDRSNVGMSASRSQKIQHYKDLLIELKEYGGTLAEMTLTGISDSDEASIEDDADYRPNEFQIGRDDNPGSTTSG